MRVIDRVGSAGRGSRESKECSSCKPLKRSKVKVSKRKPQQLIPPQKG